MAFAALLLAVLFFAGASRLHAQNFVFTNTQSASVTGLFTKIVVITNIPDPNVPAVITSTNAPSTVSGYRFTHWTVGGVRIEDITGRAANPVTIVMSNANVSAVANYVPVTNYTSDTLIPDWFKLEYYGSTATNAASDSDLDGFDLGTEYFRGYHPRVFNELVEGGVSRRRSETLVVLTSTNYARVTILSEPAGITNGFAVVTNTGTLTLPATITYSGYTFIGWFVDTNRMDSPQGLSLGNLSFTITNDVTFVAKFVLSTLDSDGDGLLDGYELYNFNTLTNTAASDPDGDGFSIAVENFRGYSPQVFNELVEGGVSRRRSETLVVLTSTNYARVTVLSEPAGITNGFAVVTNTGAFTLPSTITYSGYTFIGWFAGTNRMDSPQGLSLGNLTFTITNDVTFVAKFVLSTLDSDGDGLLDGYELYNFNSLTNTAASDPDGDGFSIAVENFRGYSPQVFNELVEGGVSRRRSETLFFVPAPPDFGQQPASSTNLAGTNVVLTVVGHGIGALTYQWRLNGVTLDGATNATLTITNAQFTNSGSFSVVVLSPYGASNSAPAPVIVTDGTPGFNLGMTDAFPGPLFTDVSRTGLGSNLGATRQTGEPTHAGKPGTNSVWLTWRAPSSGIARVSTLGSGFDTLLGVYTGSDVATLTRVASDDDSGGFYTSALVFNATAGTDYRFAVDGLAGSTGHILLSWSLEITDAEVPRIIAQPTATTVVEGGRLPLEVQVVSTNEPSYQWYKNGLPVTGADRNKLVLENVSLGDAGVYHVAVWIGTRTNYTEPASIQVASRTDTQVKDKLLEVIADANAIAGQSLSANAGSQPGQGRNRVTASLTPPKGSRVAMSLAVVPITLGIPETHGFNNFDSRTDPFDFSYAGMNWFSTDHLLRTPATNGVLLVESRTTGAQVAVSIRELLGNDYSRAGQSWFSTNSSPGMVRLAVPVKGGTNYIVTWCTSSKSSVQYTNDIALVDGTLKIIQQPADAAIATGGSTQLRVLAAAQGTASGGTSIVPLEDLRYQWWKNGALIIGATSPTLTVTSTGSYSVVVTNVLGSVTSSNATVTLAAPVAISAQPAAVTAILGQSASFGVTATGSAPLSYQWFRNGVAIPGAKAVTHLNSSVETRDAGTYVVGISNAVNAVTSSIVSLTVLVPPSVSVQPQSRINNALTDASFTVNASGTAPLSYQWLFNGTVLANQSSSSLALPAVTTNAAGSYRVVITNIAGSVTSSVAVLTVNRLVPALTWPTPGAITYGTGLSSAQLNASAGLVGGGLTYSPGVGAVLGAGTRTLNVTFTPDDPSVYNPNTAAVSLLVNPAPLTITADNKTRIYGQTNPVLTVSYSGFVNGETNTILTPMPTVTTTADVNSLPTNYPITVSGAVAANYSIVHVGGMLTVTADGPAITTSPTNLTVLATSNATFTVTATGTGPLFHQWRFNSTNILSGATNASLTVTNAQPGNAGGYSVVVTNVAGSVTSVVAVLTVLVPPSVTEAPTNLAVNALADAAFTVTAAGTGPLSYRWEKNGLTVPDATSATLSLVNVTTNAAGSYRVVITNVAGSVTSSVAVLTVNRLVPTLTWPTPGAITYGTALSSAQLNASAGLVGGGLTYSPGVGAVLGAGTRTLNVTFTPDDPSVYNPNTAAVSLLVNPAPLTITADNKTRIYGQTNPVLTVSYSGFVNGETNTILTPMPTVTTTADVNSLPTNYPITVSGAVAANYLINYIGGTLTVTATGPAITGGLTNLLILKSNNATFGATLSGTPPLSYQWFFNGTNRLGWATNSSVTLTNAIAENAGDYSVVVTNSAGGVTGLVARVIVVAPPTDLVRSLGGAGTFGMVVSGVRPTRYQWRKDGIPLVGATTNALRLINLQWNDAGAYDVIFESSLGQFLLPAATLTLTGPVSSGPPVIVQQPHELRVVEGRPAGLFVAANGGNLAYQWFKETALLSGATNSLLRFTTATGPDTGWYALLVTNSSGSVTSAPISLLVVPGFAMPQTTAQKAAVRTRGFGTSVEVNSGSSYQVQYRESLNTNDVWLVLTNFTAQGTAFEFLDAQATNRAMRVYRVIPAP